MVWKHRILLVVIFVTVAGEVRAEEGESRVCELDELQTTPDPHRVLDEETGAGISYRSRSGGMAPGGGDFCDINACCGTHIEREIVIEEGVFDEIDNDRPAEPPPGLLCSRRHPDVTVERDHQRVHVAEPGGCSVFEYDDERYHPSDVVEEPQRDNIQFGGPGRNTSATRNFEEGRFSLGWLHSRRASHVEFVGRVGSSCDYERAKQYVRALHEQLEIARTTDRPRDLTTLLHTDLLRRSCGLVHPELRIDDEEDARATGAAHFSAPFSEAGDERRELFDKLFDIGEFAAEEGYGRVAREFTRGAVAYELDAEDGFELAGEDTAEVLGEAGWTHLSGAWRSDDALAEMPEDVDTYDTWLLEYLTEDEPARAVGAWSMGNRAGERPRNSNRRVDERVLEYLHERVTEADERADRTTAAAYLWLLDDWLLVEPDSSFFSRAPQNHSGMQDDHVSSFPYVDVQMPEDPGEDLQLGEGRVVAPSCDNLDALRDLAAVALRMGRQRWFFPRIQDYRSISANPNEMPVVRRWLDEILRHRPDDAEAHLQLGHWHWQAARFELGFDREIYQQQLEDRLAGHRFDAEECELRQEEIDELSRQVTGELVDRQRERVAELRDTAREHWRRHVELQGGDETVLPAHIRSRLAGHPTAGCELKTTILDAPPTSTDETSAQFGFDCNGEDCRFECSLDGRSFRFCESPMEYDELQPGLHQFAVRARDATDDRVSAPKRMYWQIDTEPPNSALISAPESPLRSGEGSFEFECDAPESCQFECRIDVAGWDWESCESPWRYGSGALRSNVAGEATLPAGEHTFLVRATDAAGNTEESPAHHEFTVEPEDWTRLWVAPTHVFAQTADETLWRWGLNTSRQLARPSSTSPYRVGTYPLPLPYYSPFDNPAAVTGSGEHTCMLGEEGRLRCLGYDKLSPRWHVELPDDDSPRWHHVAAGGIDESEPVESDADIVLDLSTSPVGDCGIDEQRRLWCWSRTHVDRDLSGRMDTTVTLFEEQHLVDDSHRFREVTRGADHQCAITDEDTLWCRGDNDYGQLGVGDTDSRDELEKLETDQGWQTVAATGDFTCAIDTDDRLWCWGQNDHGQLGDGTTDDRHRPVQIEGRYRQVAVGRNHTCAIDTDDRLWCWGDNDHGQLGVGEDQTSQRTAPEEVEQAQIWNDVGAGDGFSCAIRHDLTLWCWGRNNEGQLGDGTDESRDSPVQIPGL